MKTHIRYFSLLGLVVLGLLVGSLSPARAVGVFVNIGIAPPPLPVYVQPACPGLGYMWTPGYWAWDPTLDDYYWVPGTWVLSPEIGFLWTPPWWGCDNGFYSFHDGYWGPHVGFYGGIAYGNGYYGRGYDGGNWRGGHFFYNRAANNVAGIDSSRTFSRSVATNASRVSFNGGTGGTTARATADELRAQGENHLAATAAQRTHLQAAAADPSLRNSVNHGRPAITATSRAGEIHPATAGANTAISHHTATTGESAFTGERHTAIATQSHVNHAVGSSGNTAFTGERHVASTTHTATTHVRTAQASAFHASAPATRAHVQSYHAPAVHAASHAPAFHAAAAHAPASHAASHASAHASASHGSQRR